MTSRDPDPLREYPEPYPPYDNEPGPDTVRILPEDADTVLMSPAELAQLERAAELRRSQMQAGHTPASPTVQGAVPYGPSSRGQALQISDSAEVQRSRSGWSAGEPPAGNPPTARRSASTCAIVTITLAVLVFACALLAFAGANEGMNRLFGWIPNPFGPAKTEIDVSRPTLLESIRNVSELTTVKYQMEKIIIGKSTGALPDWLISDKLVLIAYGEVAAGIDLGKLEEDDIKVVSDTVRINMPAAQIIYTRIDNGKTTVFQRDTTIFTRADPNLETLVRQEAEKQMLAAAEESGIKRQAQTNAEQVLRSLLRGLGYNDVEFTFDTEP